jgi:hypothetical protein
MGGRYIHRETPAHQCGCPRSGMNIGDVWQCDCGQKWRYSHPPSKHGAKRWLQV